MRQICMSGSMSGVWKRSHGRTSEAPPDERGGNSYARPTATAPHSDSTTAHRYRPRTRSAAVGRRGRSALADETAGPGIIPAATFLVQILLRGENLASG